MVSGRGSAELDVVEAHGRGMAIREGHVEFSAVAENRAISKGTIGFFRHGFIHLQDTTLNHHPTLAVEELDGVGGVLDLRRVLDSAVVSVCGISIRTGLRDVRLCAPGAGTRDAPLIKFFVSQGSVPRSIRVDG